MDSSNLSVCKQFSQGNFATVYASFDDAIEWEIVGGQTVKGKGSVIDFCASMMTEMHGSVLTNENCIETENQIAIQGSCSYLNEHEQESFLQYCDIYCLENSKITRITSYCIDQPVKK